MCVKLGWVTLACLMLSNVVLADDYLFGDLGGLRESLTDKGVTVESVLTVDSLSNVSGGLEKGSAILGNFDLAAEIDLEKVGLWSNGKVFLYGIANFGDEMTALVGDYQATDNIEAYGTAKLYEAWYEHEISDSVSILAGLHDYNSEFYALEHAAGLLNSSFGLGVEASQAGPSIFPSTSLAGRVRIAPTETSYILLAAYDGLPGSAYDQVGTQISLSSSDGIFYAGEVGLLGTEEDYYKLGLGGWYHTVEFVDYTDAARDQNYGAYLIGETDLGEKLGAFAQVGWARQDRNQVGNYYGGGLTYSGLLPSRADDLLSLGFAMARNSSDFRDAFAAEAQETAYELNYRIQATPFLAVTPDIQFVHNPGMDASVHDAVQVGFRLELAL